MAAQTMSLRPSVMVQRQCAANAKVSSIHTPMVLSRRVSLVKDITPAKRQSLVANMGAVEVAQVAGEAGYIGGVAGVMFGITLVGLALGFVLLRVESLAEEGKI